MTTLQKAAAGNIPAVDMAAIKAGKIPSAHLEELEKTGHELKLRKPKLTLLKGILI